jgi:hypothetical protein
MRNLATGGKFDKFSPDWLFSRCNAAMLNVAERIFFLEPGGSAQYCRPAS